MAAFYCNGKAYDVDTVPGRIGANQVGAPYKNPYLTGPYGTGTTGYCSDACTAADYPYATSGYKACSGWNNVVTTYRKAATGGSITKAATTNNVAATITRYFDTPFGYCANVNVTNKTTAPIASWSVSYDTLSAVQYFQWLGVEVAPPPASPTGPATPPSVHTIKGAGPMLALPPSGTRSVGFCARYVGGSVAPVLKSVTTL